MPLPQLKKIVIKGINQLGISSSKIGTPKGIVDTKNWCLKNVYLPGVSYTMVHKERDVQEDPPLTIESDVHKLYKDEFTRKQPETFVACIPNGRVWGRYGAVITPDDILLKDVSRQFGRYKGVYGKKHGIFNRLNLGPLQKVEANVAVISTAGCYNYYHWMMDVLPRFELLMLAGVLEKVDFFVIDYIGLPFQKESLKRLNIPVAKVIACNDEWHFHLQAKKLWLPSLPSFLSTMSKWQVDFLRRLFLTSNLSTETNSKLFISRKKALNRKLINEDEVISFLEGKGFEVFFPEDYTIEGGARKVATAQWVIGVHSAGLTNVAFGTMGVKVIDIISPSQINPIYWLLTNNVQGRYAYLQADGEKYDVGVDLVEHKQNEDFIVSIEALEKTMSLFE